MGFIILSNHKLEQLLLKKSREDINRRALKSAGNVPRAGVVLLFHRRKSSQKAAGRALFRHPVALDTNGFLPCRSYAAGAALHGRALVRPPACALH